MAGWGVQNCPILRDVIYGRPPKCVWKYVNTFLWDYKSTKTTLFFTLTISGLMSFFFLVFLLPDVEAAEELLVLELDRDRISKLWQTPQTMQPKLEDWNKLESSRTLISKIFIYFTTKDEYWGFSLGFIKSFVKMTVFSLGRDTVGKQSQEIKIRQNIWLLKGHMATLHWS